MDSRQQRQFEIRIYDDAYYKEKNNGSPIADCYRAGWTALQRWRMMNARVKSGKPEVLCGLACAAD